MIMPGFSEWLIIGGIALLIWGPSKLPQLGGAVGKALRNFKTATSGNNDSDKNRPGQEDKEASNADV